MKNIIFLLFLILFPLLSFAATYKYIDKNGVVVFTDDYESIPPELKSKVTVVKDDTEKTVPKPLDRQENTTITPEVKKESTSDKTITEKIQHYFYDNMVQKAFVVLLLLIIFVFAGRILKNVENKKIVVLIRLGVVFVMAIFLFQSYLERAQSQYEELKSDAEKLRMKAINRGAKADEIVK